MSQYNVVGISEVNGKNCALIQAGEPEEGGRIQFLGHDALDDIIKECAQGSKWYSEDYIFAVCKALDRLDLFEKPGQQAKRPALDLNGGEPNLGNLLLTLARN